MHTPGWTVTLVLLGLFGSATPSPVSIHTPTPPLLSQISSPPPFPAPLQSRLSSTTLSTTPSTTSPEELSPESAPCPLKMSPSTLVVRYGDPATANCSIQSTGFPFLGWEVPQPDTPYTEGHFLVWSVERMTNWTVKPICFTLLDQGGKCDISLSVIVYQPPERVAITLANHTGPMLEGHQYTLECLVQDVAPVENLSVTFYKGRTPLGQLHSNSTTVRTPVTEIFTLDIVASKDDNGTQYWCEAKLDLGPEGPQPPPIVMSEKVSAIVHFEPLLNCPPKLQVREGESVICRNAANGTTNSWNGYFLLVALLTQMINWW